MNATQNAPVDNPVAEVTSEWVFAQHQQQQSINADILGALRELRSSITAMNTPTQPGVNLQGPHPTHIERLYTEMPTVSYQTPKHILPRPEYTHDDPSLFSYFRDAIREKLRIDELACGRTEEDRAWYAFFCLKGKAAARVHPWMATQRRLQIPVTLTTFLEQLDVSFNDPARTQRAIEKINNIKQGNRSFREFFHDFELTAMEAGGSTWEDSVRKGFLKAALNQKLRAALVATPIPARYMDYVELIKFTSDNVEDLRGNSSSAPPFENRTTDAMEWQATPVANVRLQGEKRRASFVPKVVVAKRKEQNLCLKCGSNEHFAKGCRKGWTIDQEVRRTARAKVEEPLIELEPEDSGKE